VHSALAGPRPDLVHVHNTWFALSPAVLRGLARARLPVVLTVHNYRLTCVSANLLRDGRPCQDCLGRSPLPGVRHRCYRDSAVASAAVAATISLARRREVYHRDVAAILVPSSHARDLLAVAGLPRERMHVVPNVVPDRSVGTDPAPSTSRKVLYVGRLTREKGVDVLLEAWRSARPEGMVLEVAGEGALAPDVSATDGVRLLGRLSPEQVAERMRVARAVVVPSVWDEPFGLVVAEAFAAGRPVLAAHSGALPELLAAADSTHWLVEPGAAAAWAHALRELSTGAYAADADAAGRRGRAAYERQWTPHHGLERLLQVYDLVTTG
jgi:glycosyltransferase involved in cell wall biosynthesis